MTSTKTILLAAATVVSLGVGHAMAQDGGGAVSDYWAQQYRATAQTSNAPAVQFGSSDVARPNGFHIDTDLTGGGL
jgi:hypothetical protein